MALPPGSLLQLTPQGLYCRAAEAWIDPYRPVSRALKPMPMQIMPAQAAANIGLLVPVK